MKTVMTFTAANGLRYDAILRDIGDLYGRNDCLTVDKGALLEFQLYNVHGKPQGMGWTYYARTICAGQTTGLCLQGGAPEYDIDAHSMAVVRQWAGNEIHNANMTLKVES